MERKLKISIIFLVLILFSVMFFTKSQGRVRLVGDYLIEVKDLEIGESLGEQLRTLSVSTAPFLKSGLIVTKEGRTDYTQSLKFYIPGGDDPIESGRVIFSEDESGNVNHFLFFKRRDDIFEYEIIFGSGLESRIKDGRLTDIEDKGINILGQKFVFVNSAIDPDKKAVGFTLVSGNAFDRLMEGETRTLQTASQLIQLSVLNINENTAEVIFEVNGKTSKSLKKGETEVMPNGFRIAVKDVIPNEAGDPGLPDFVELYLGTMKIEFVDRNFEDNQFDNGGVKLQNENIENARVSIIGNMLGEDKFEINSIRYRLEAHSPQGDLYIPKGGSLKSSLTYPQAMLSTVWDIRYGGLKENIKIPSRALPTKPFSRSLSGGTPIKFDASGIDSYKLKFVNAKGKAYSISFVDNSGTFKYGDRDDQLIFKEPGSPTGFNIKLNDYFLVVNSPIDQSSHSAVLRYQSIDLANKVIKFTDLATGTKSMKFKDTGSDPEVGNIGIGQSVLGVGDLISGGNKFRVYVSPGPGNPLSIDLNNDNKVDGGESKIVVYGGGIMDIGNSQSPGSSIDVTLRTLGRFFDDPRPDEIVTIKVFADGGQVDLRVEDQTELKMFSTKDGNFEQGMTDFGVFFNLRERSGKPNELEINYPRSQRLPSVVIGG